MFIERHVPLQQYNTFGIVAKAEYLLRISDIQTCRLCLHDPVLQAMPKFILGGGSNIVITGDIPSLVLKVEIKGRSLLDETSHYRIVQAAAGENWHEFVQWTLEQGWPGLENMALIPGTVGAAPVQNIGAYGLELQDRFDSLDAIDLQTGREFTLNAAQCGFGYRDSVFKRRAHMPSDHGLAGRALITHVRFRLPKLWKPELSYSDLFRKHQASGVVHPSPIQVFDWVCAIRRAKLPDPLVLGNAGSFFKNPTVTEDQWRDIIGRDPKVVYYKLADGRIKLAAAWLIDACGWRGKSVGNASVYDKQALVIVNRGGVEHPCSGGEVMTLAHAIETSVYERFGIRLEPEPVLV